MIDLKPSRSLQVFAAVTAAATLVLICIGGLVTSRGSGLAVPDWPTTYGYNMFFFPFSFWVGGILEEHSHRLAGSVVGLLTTLLAFWLYGRRARLPMRWIGALGLVGGAGVWLAARGRVQDAFVLLGVGSAFLAMSFVWPACDPAPRWLRRLGLVAWVAVVVQGALGGLRVTLLSDVMGVVHGTLAQLFFSLMVAIALFLSRTWRERPQVYRQPDPAGLRTLVLVTSLLLLGQLVLGATMRHQRAGLAIPDFPLAYGSLWPATDAKSVEVYNQTRMEVAAVNPIRPAHIHLQMTHRMVAAVLVTLIALSFWRAQRALGWSAPIARWSAGWFGLVLVQFLLGAATVWTGKSADVATAHVGVGALTFATGVWLTIYTRATLAFSGGLSLAGSRPAPRLSGRSAPAVGGPSARSA